MKNFGIILIAAGIIMMVITGVNFVTKEKVLEVGKVEIAKEKSHPINWNPIVGAILIASGIMIIAIGKEKIKV